MEVQRVNNLDDTSITMRACIIGYSISIFFYGVEFCSLNYLELMNLGVLSPAVFGVFYVLIHKSLNTRLKAIAVIGITMVGILALFMKAELEVTRDLLIQQIVPQTSLIIISSLKWAFYTQILALILDAYLGKSDFMIFKATNNEFIFVETLILILTTYYAHAYVFVESKDMTVILTVLVGYVMIKILTIFQTRALKAIEGV